MKTYNKSDFHNPEQLTRQQVGDGYRLLLGEELPSARKFYDEIQIILVDYWVMASGDSKGTTYRVPLATPLPDGTVLSSNECCFSDAPAMSDDEHFAMMNSARISQSLPPSYLDAILDAAKKPKPRLYLAGPMSSHPDDFNFPAFFKAASELEKQGYEVINPAQMDLDRGYSPERLKQLSPAEHQQFLKEAVKLDLDAIQTCQAIAMLPGWESSKGAKAELAVAQWLGLDEVYLEDAKTPYNSDERAEWSNDWCKLDMGSYCISKEEAEKHTIKFAPDDPKGAAGAKKAPMDLLPPDALLETARAMGHGAAKYGRWNYIEAKVCAHTYVAAIGRHWASYAKGQDDDTESGLKHLAHIAANAFILLTAAQQGTLNDDRPKLK